MRFPFLIFIVLIFCASCSRKLDNNQFDASRLLAVIDTAPSKSTENFIEQQTKPFQIELEYQKQKMLNTLNLGERALFSDAFDDMIIKIYFPNGLNLFGGKNERSTETILQDMYKGFTIVNGKSATKIMSDFCKNEIEAGVTTQKEELLESKNHVTKTFNNVAENRRNVTSTQKQRAIEIVVSEEKQVNRVIDSANSSGCTFQQSLEPIFIRDVIYVEQHECEGFTDIVKRAAFERDNGKLRNEAANIIKLNFSEKNHPAMQNGKPQSLANAFAIHNEIRFRPLVNIVFEKPILSPEKEASLFATHCKEAYTVSYYK